MAEDDTQDIPEYDVLFGESSLDLDTFNTREFTMSDWDELNCSTEEIGREVVQKLIELTELADLGTPINWIELRKDYLSASPPRERILLYRREDWDGDWILMYDKDKGIDEELTPREKRVYEHNYGVTLQK